VAPNGNRPFWRRILVPLAVAVAALNLLAFLAFTVPRTWRLGRVVSRAVNLRKEVAQERSLTAAHKARVEAASNNRRDVERFYKEMVRRPEESLLPTLQEIEVMAHQPGLVAGKRGYTREALKGVPLTRVSIRLPLEGSYQNLVGFLEKVERGKRFLTVDKVALSHNSEGRGGEAKLQVEMSAFFREDAPVDPHGG
jgi:Tfp pilus assembly protein PilO